MGFKPDKGFLSTAKIESTDADRDDAYMYYLQIVNATANYCPDAEKKEAGQTLAFAFRLAGGSSLSVQDYTSETSTLNDLVRRLEEEPYASALTTLGIEEAPEVIKAKNDAFTEVYRERYTPERERAFSTNLKDLRAATDDAFDQLAQAINAIYTVNEIVTKDEETRTALEKVIDDINGAIINYKRVTGSSSSTGTEGETEEEPTPEPVKPAITEVYSKVEDPHDPTGITRGKETIMKWVGGFELVNETGDGPGKIIVKDNFTGVEEEVPAEDILSRSNTGCEFIMIRDFAEGDYKIRIETYDGGSPLVLEYPEVIKLV